MDNIQRITLGLAVVFFAFFLAHSIYKSDESKKINEPQETKSANQEIDEQKQETVAETLPPPYQLNVWFER